MSLTRLTMYNTASANLTAVTIVYRCPPEMILDPDGYCLVGEFRIPIPGELFLSKAHEAVKCTQFMRIDSPRLILALTTDRKHKYPPVNGTAKLLIEQAYRQGMEEFTCSNLAFVSMVTVSAWYQYFEMADWKREQEIREGGL